MAIFWHITSDIRFAFRHYRATPFGTAFVLSVLAIAMSLLAGFLSLWSEIALKPHGGFADPERLVTISDTANDPNLPLPPLPLLLIENIDAQVEALDAVAGITAMPQVVDRGGDLDALTVTTEIVTQGFFSGLRPTMALGRGLIPDDHRAAARPVVVLSHAFWQQHFAGDSDAVGETLRVRGPSRMVPGPQGPINAADQTQDYRVVGVLARSMAGTFSGDVALWMPYEQVANAWWGSAGGVYETAPHLSAVGRLAADSNPASLKVELNNLLANVRQDVGMGSGSLLQVVSGVVQDARVKQDVERQIRLFLLSSILLAIVAAGNASLFLFSRAPNRIREVAIRLAIGASNRRLAGQLTTEAGLLVVAASLLAIPITIWVVAVLRNLAGFQEVALGGASPFDWRALLMIAGAALLLTILVSLAPVIGLKRLGVSAGSRMVTGRPGCVQVFASTVQIALASVLGGVALAFLWYVAFMVNTDHGFVADNLHVVSPNPNPPASAVAPDQNARLLAERERRREVIEGLPGVDGVAFGTSVPGRQIPLSRVQIPRPDETAESVPVWLEAIDYGYPALLGMTLLAGDGLDAAAPNGVLVNETLARRVWGRTDVVGELLRVPVPFDETWEVAGVLKDVAYGHPASATQPMAYRLILPTSFMEQIVIRSSSSTSDIRRMLEQRADQGELGFGIGSVQLLADMWSALLAPDRARTLITAVTATIVVLFAGLGFYGTQSYLVAAGRREYAIRSAVGAVPEALGRLVLWRGVRLSIPGLVLGALLCFGAVASLRADYFSIAVSPLAVTLAVGVGIALLALLASLGPSRQACSRLPAPVLNSD